VNYVRLVAAQGVRFDEMANRATLGQRRSGHRQVAASLPFSRRLGGPECLVSAAFLALLTMGCCPLGGVGFPRLT
jgi:hypothetical protein